LVVWILVVRGEENLVRMIPWYTLQPV
jgi:hypothetical protein